MPLARWVNEVKWTTLDYIALRGGLRYSRRVPQRRPGIAKAAPLPPELAEEQRGSAVLRAVIGDLEALISRQSASGAAAFVWGTWELGGARLVPGSIETRSESLRVAWNRNEIESIEIESGGMSSFRGPEAPADSALLLERLVPMLWAHIRRGGTLPPGIDRFARFL
jgi:hypothetical protein